jgi:hypothetical protein
MVVFDPLVQIILSLGFGCLFAVSGISKFLNRESFESVLRGYDLLLEKTVPFSAVLVAGFELCLGFLWLSLNGGSFVAIGSASLLLTYAVVITINLVRGRNYIDCGCGFSSLRSDLKKSPSGLSFYLVLRNVILICFAFLTLVPVFERMFNVLDYFIIVFSLICSLLFYGAMGQLLANRSTINSWRQSNA